MGYWLIEQALKWIHLLCSDVCVADRVKRLLQHAGSRSICAASIQTCKRPLIVLLLHDFFFFYIFCRFFWDWEAGVPNEGAEFIFTFSRYWTRNSASIYSSLIFGRIHKFIGTNDLPSVFFESQIAKITFWTDLLDSRPKRWERHRATWRMVCNCLNYFDPWVDFLTFSFWCYFCYCFYILSTTLFICSSGCLPGCNAFFSRSFSKGWLGILLLQLEYLSYVCGFLLG